MEKEFESSLKSVETENLVDLHFYRPIGYSIARALRHTPVTPNMVTVFSIFVGSAPGWLFYFDKWSYTLTGVFLMIAANVLDCVDGQLARLTGVKSEIGRILDGIAGDIWFITIYIGLALRLTHLTGTAWWFAPAVASGLSHLVQANITDYYKTLHLYFTSKEKGKEFANLQQVKQQHKSLPNGIHKAFYLLYEGYTGVQERLTPKLQQLLQTIHHTYGDDIPENIRLEFRRKSRKLMKRYVDMMTFNGRTIVLFAAVLSGYVWVYFVYEILVLNTVLRLAMHGYEKMCSQIENNIRQQNNNNNQDSAT